MGGVRIPASDCHMPPRTSNPVGKRDHRTQRGRGLTQQTAKMTDGSGRWHICWVAAGYIGARNAHDAAVDKRRSSTRMQPRTTSTAGVAAAYGGAGSFHPGSNNAEHRKDGRRA